MGAIGDLNVRLGVQVKEWNRKLRGAERSLAKLAKNSAKTGAAFTSGLTVPLVAAGVASVKVASDFEFSMGKITSQVGLASETVQGMRKDVLKLSGETAQAPQALAEGLFFITSAGLRGKDALEALEHSAKGAATGFGEVKTVADLMTSAMNAYKSSNLTAAQSMDIMAATVREGKAEASELTAVMGGALPQATALGIGFDQLGGSVAAMTRTGTTAASAVSQLKGIMMVFQKPSKEAVKIATRLGTSFEELRSRIKKEGLLNVLVDLKKRLAEDGTEMAEFFRKSEALNGVLDLTGDGLEDNIGIMKRMADSTGVANKAFETAAETSQFKFKQALADLQAAGIDLGGSLLPMATSLANKVSSLAKSFSGLSSENKTLIVNTGLLLAAVGPMFSIFSKGVVIYSSVSSAIMRVNQGLKLAKTAYMRTMVAQRAANAGMVTFTGTLKSAKVAFMAFNAVSKAAGIGLVVAAVAGAVMIFREWNKEIDATKRVLDLANESIAGQKKNAELLTEVIEDETSTLDQKEKALNRLKGISKEYYGQLKIEKGEVEGLTAATEGYVEALLSQAKVKAASDQINKLAKQQFELQQSLKDLESKTGFNRFIGEAAVGALNAGNTSSLLKKQIADLEKEMQALAKISNSESIIPPVGEDAKAAKAEVENLNAEVSKLNTSISSSSKPAKKKKKDECEEKKKKHRSQDNDRKLGSGHMTRQAEELALALRPLPLLYEQVTDATLGSEAAIKMAANTTKTASDQASLMSMVYAEMAESMKEMAASGETSFKKLGAAALKSAAVQVKAAMQAGIARAIASAIGTGPFGLLLAAGAGAAASLLFNKALKAIKVPGFANGVNNFQGGMAMVGERGPERVILPKGSNVIPNSRINNGNGSQAVEVMGQVVIRGDDLYVLFKNAELKRSRIGL